MSVPFIIADESLRAKLEAANGPVPICASDGRVLAYATPTKAATLNLQPQISEEEIQRRIKAGGGRKLTDILRDLEG
jgi:hypothetical protein